MSLQDILQPLLGGALIGTAVSLMLLWNGRVTGISGITNGVLNPERGDTAWRAAFLGGLLSGGLLLGLLNPGVFEDVAGRGLPVIIVAGFIVGFGTIMGNGCTSGHGVCGLSRLSLRSLVATGVFMVLGFITVTAFRILTTGGM